MSCLIPLEELPSFLSFLGSLFHTLLLTKDIPSPLSVSLTHIYTHTLTKMWAVMLVAVPIAQICI